MNTVYSAGYEYLETLARNVNVVLMKRLITVSALLAITLPGISACSTWGVKPWERGTLSRPDMSLASQPMVGAIDDHIYFSKEASSGGRSFGGGGCGCN